MIKPAMTDFVKIHLQKYGYRYKRRRLVIITAQLIFSTDYASAEASPGNASEVDLELLRALLDLDDVDEYDESTLSPLSKLEYAQQYHESTIDYGTTTTRRQVTSSPFIQRETANENQSTTNTIDYSITRRQVDLNSSQFIQRETANENQSTTNTLDYGTTRRRVDLISSQFIQRETANENQRTTDTKKANLGIAVDKKEIITGSKDFMAREGEGVIPRPPTYKKKKKRVKPKAIVVRLLFPLSTTTYSYLEC